MNNSQKIAAIQRILRKSGDWTGKIDGRPSTQLYKAIKIGISKSIAYNGTKDDINNLTKAGIDTAADIAGKRIGNAMDNAAKTVGRSMTDAAPGLMAAAGAKNADGWPIGVNRDIDTVENHVGSAKIDKSKDSRASYMAVASKLDKCALLTKGKPTYDRWVAVAKLMRSRVYQSFAYTDSDVAAMTDPAIILNAYTDGDKVSKVIKGSYPDAYTAIQYGMKLLNTKYKDVTGKGSFGTWKDELGNRFSRSVNPDEISSDMKADALGDILTPGI